MKGWEERGRGEGKGLSSPRKKFLAPPLLVDKFGADCFQVCSPCV